MSYRQLNTDKIRPIEPGLSRKPAHCLLFLPEQRVWRRAVVQTVGLGQCGSVDPYGLGLKSLNYFLDLLVYKKSTFFIL